MLTTPIIITVPMAGHSAPNHRPVRIMVHTATKGDQTRPQGWIDGSIHEIEIGQSMQVYVYSGQRLMIEEIPA